jgi:hypothetical protein
MGCNPDADKPKCRGPICRFSSEAIFYIDVKRQLVGKKKFNIYDFDLPAKKNVNKN